MNPLIRPRFKVFVSQDKSVFYFAIPKNANSFLKALFLSNSSASEDFDPSHDTVIEYLQTNPKKRKCVFAKRRDLLSDVSGRDKVVVIRDPAQRLVSCFLDKIVKKGLFSESTKIFCEDYSKVVGEGIRPSEISFERFVEYVSKTPDFRRDPHFKSQSSFIKWVKIDRYFDFENLAEFQNYLQSRGFSELHKSGTVPGVLKSTNYCPVEADYAGDKSIKELNEKNFYPPFHSFYNGRTFDLLVHSYKCDVELWNRIVKRQRFLEWQSVFPHIERF